MPAPEVGGPLPRAADAYVEEAKWWRYVLADDGHGPHWQRVFRVELDQAGELWERFAEIARNAQVSNVRPSGFGIGCAIRAELTFNGRTADVVLGWFYDRPEDAPRLVTAYPTS